MSSRAACKLLRASRSSVFHCSLPSTLAPLSTSATRAKRPPNSQSVPPNDKTKSRKPDKINYNRSPLSSTSEPEAEHLRYPLVTANDLTDLKEPPTGTRMLVRDFIEDSLYNPHYGYFPKQVNIFSATDGAQDPVDFGSLRDAVEFQEEVARRYAHYGVDADSGPGRQIWHTPTELFQPFYGQALALCLVSEYLLKYFPYEDFVIYEIGAGNGTLAQNILDYIRDAFPHVYDRTRYHIIEISGNLAQLQKQRLRAAGHTCVSVVHQSVLHWDRTEPAPCYFVAMEVVDNFAHDLIRYDLRTLEPYQGLVTIDEAGDFSVHYTRITDPLIQSFLDLRKRLGHDPATLPRPLLASPLLRTLYANMPFAPNLSALEYIPTRLLQLLSVLRAHFPRHRLLLSDFSSLPDAISKGGNAPVVQTRYRGTTVPCSTLLVKQGYFDIFFPTDFERLRDMYEAVLAQPHARPLVAGQMGPDDARASPLSGSTTPLSTGSPFFTSYHPTTRRAPTDGIVSSSGLPVGERKSGVHSHSEFMSTYANLERTSLRSGENPMLDFYQNVKFLF